jgi:aminomethyltransferase
MTGEDLKSLPLEDLHKAAGARFGGFAGWSMPLTYPPGVMKEHLHTREHVGLFDISHMKLFEVSGPDAAALLDRACPLQAAALELSQSKYTFLLTEQAGVVDDLIVTRLGPERFMVVANAGNAAADEAHLKALARDFDATVTPLDRVFLAIQGPEAAAVLLKAGIETDAITFMHGLELRHDWILSRSGYTGEDGFAIGDPDADAVKQRALELLPASR